MQHNSRQVPAAAIDNFLADPSQRVQDSRNDESKSRAQCPTQTP